MRPADAAHHAPVRAPAIAVAISLILACKEEPRREVPGRESLRESPRLAAETVADAAPAADARAADARAADARDAAPPPAPPPESTGACTIEIDGALKLKETAPGGPPAISTDYWLSEESLRRVVSHLETDPARIEAAMKANPRFMTLIINCRGPRASISFMPEEGSRYADIPYRPKKYALASGKRGSFRPLTLIDRAAYRTRTGTLDITRFDDHGLTATYQFEATDIATDKQVTIRGAIDFPCPPGYDKCRR